MVKSVRCHSITIITDTLCVPLLCYSGAHAHRRRASGAPFLRNFGKPLSQENLVMMSAYERTPSVQTRGEGEGSIKVTLTGEIKKKIARAYVTLGFWAARD